MGHPGSSSHREFEDMALSHVLGGLDEARSRTFRAHLIECDHCRARVGELRALASDLAGVEREARSEAPHSERQGARSPSASPPVERRRSPRPREPVPAAVPDPPSPPQRLRALALAAAALALIVVLAAAVAWLRAENATMEEQLEQRLAASAALVHGEDEEVAFLASGLEATARSHEGALALLVEGLDDGDHTLALRHADRPAPHLERATARDGQVFLVVEPRPGDEQAVLSAAPADGDAGPTGDPLVIVELDD